MFANIGKEIYESWSEDQKRAEIEKLADGLRSGLPLQICLKMATAIAGTPDAARDHLIAVIPAEERHTVVMREKGEDRTLAASFLM